MPSLRVNNQHYIHRPCNFAPFSILVLVLSDDIYLVQPTLSSIDDLRKSLTSNHETSVIYSSSFIIALTGSATFVALLDSFHMKPWKPQFVENSNQNNGTAKINITPKTAVN